MNTNVLADPLRNPADRAWLVEILGRLEYRYQDTLDELYPCPCCFEAAELIGSSDRGLTFRCESCGMTFERGVLR
jgi:hypothetical protein